MGQRQANTFSRQQANSTLASCIVYLAVQEVLYIAVQTLCRFAPSQDFLEPGKGTWGQQIPFEATNKSSFRTFSGLS